MRKVFFVLALAMVAVLTATADRRPYMVDSLQTRLQTLTTAADSLHTLQDILDLSAPNKDVRMRTAKQIYDVAGRVGDSVAMIESLAYRVNAGMEDSALIKDVIATLKESAPSPRVEEAKLFSEMLLTRKRMVSGTQPSRHDISEFIQRAMSTEKMSDYDRTLLLYTICLQLANETRGPLLEEYYDRLITLVDGMDLPMGSVRNLVYNNAAMVFSNNQLAEKAVDMNKKLLNIVDSLADNYASQGRKFRKLDRYRYVYYRRLLINYEALSQAEVESYHNAVHRLMEENSDIEEDAAENPMVHACYLFATGKYAPSIPMFKKALEVPTNRIYRFKIYSRLYEAAERTGDKAEQLKASVALNEIMREMVESRTDERYRELQIMYDVNDLRSRNTELEKMRRKTVLRASHIVVAVSLAAAVLLFILSMVLWKRNKKMHRLSDELSNTADRLRNERNDLRQAKEELIVARDMAKSADKTKEEFIDNISHEIKTPLAAVSEYSRLIVDCIPEDQNKYLRKFADIIEVNTKLMMTLVDDLLDASLLEHGRLNVVLEGTSVYHICSIAMGNIFDRMEPANPDVKLVFNPEDKPDVSINTDRQRVVQVLINLLSNAAKFTEKGKITLDFSADEVSHMITFSVTDTGCGIAPGREEEIFKRFNVNNRNSGGIGIGLYISRLIAKLLGGNVTLDGSYRRGARFLFTVPM